MEKEEKKENKQEEYERLQEELNIVKSKKNVYINREDILKEKDKINLIKYRIFMTVSNRLELDPFVTDKLHLKKKKDEGGCCVVY